ncbi:MAG: TIGR02679 family protein [Solirubrobacteraceae bacterium]
MGFVDHERLNRLLGDPELAWVLDRARRRMGRGQPLVGSVTRNSATRAERDAVARLFGRPPRAARGVGVSLDELDTLLRRSGVHRGGLADAVVELTGPVAVLADLSACEARGWAEAFERVTRACDGRPSLEAWLERVRASGLVKRLAGGSTETSRELLDGVAAVVSALPVSAGESLGTFAARVCGRAHALDEGSPLGTLALGAARALADLESPGPDESAAEARREGWAAVGVLCDELSSTVLTLGLPGDQSATGRILAAACQCREPVWLTLRQLVRTPVKWRARDVPSVLVVENPSVVALAADTLGASCPPLLCTNGQPRAATMVLLRALAGSGVRLLHHGDFDWYGITIANLLHRRVPVEPWLYNREAYLHAVANHPHTAPLTGSPVTPSWDPQLECAMRAAGRQVEEELVASGLLELLADG